MVSKNEKISSMLRSKVNLAVKRKQVGPAAPRLCERCMASFRVKQLGKLRDCSRPNGELSPNVTVLTLAIWRDDLQLLRDNWILDPSEFNHLH